MQKYIFILNSYMLFHWIWIIANVLLLQFYHQTINPEINLASQSKEIFLFLIGKLWSCKKHKRFYAAIFKWVFRSIRLPFKCVPHHKMPSISMATIRVESRNAVYILFIGGENKRWNWRIYTQETKSIRNPIDKAKVLLFYQWSV